MKERKPVELFTDGSSQGNPGPGGYGVILQYGALYKEFSRGFRLTTNNRMELIAVIVGLEALKNPGTLVHIYTDSSYVVNAIEKGWLDKWVQTGFKKKKNRDLWERYLQVAQKHELHFFWIKGHAGHPRNERCDALAVAAAQGQNGPLLEDSGYSPDLLSDKEQFPGLF